MNLFYFYLFNFCNLIPLIGKKKVKKTFELHEEVIRRERGSDNKASFLGNGLNIFQIFVQFFFFVLCPLCCHFFHYLKKLPKDTGKDKK